MLVHIKILSLWEASPFTIGLSITPHMSLHYSYGRFSGWSFGSGGDTVARLYDKTLEVEKKSHKFYLHELWKAAGWDGTSQVWRMEFEAKRNAL